MTLTPDELELLVERFYYVIDELDAKPTMEDLLKPLQYALQSYNTK